MSNGEAEWKLQKFMKLFLLSEQIPDKWSVNKAGEVFSCASCYEDAGMLLTQYLLDATHCCDSTHAYTSVFIHNMHNHSATTQTLISGLAHKQRGISKTQAPKGNFQESSLSLERVDPAAVMDYDF